MKVKIDHTRCEANALCMESAPQVFRLDDDDVLHLLNESPSKELRRSVETAVALCPRNALSIEE